MASTSALAILKRKLEERFKETPEIFPDFSKPKQIDVIPSPSVIINMVTGIGGIPRGRVTEIHGDYSTGKTTIACEIAASLHKADPTSVVLYVDYEHAFDLSYAKKLGMKLEPERFIFVQPDTFEQGHVILDEFTAAGLMDLIVLDSAAAMIPAAELEGAVDEQGRIGLQASLMSKLLNKVTKQIDKGKKPALLILNQTRANIDMKNPRLSGGDKPAGGSALKFYTSIRLLLEIVRKDGDAARGTKGIDQTFTRNQVRVTAIKNKLAPPFMRGVLYLEYGKGTNNLESIAELAEARLGIMSGAGFFKYTGDTTETSFSLRGRDAFKAHLQQNAVVLREIEKKVLIAIAEENRQLINSAARPPTEQLEPESREGDLTITDAD